MQALVFDLDGLLIDSETACFEVAGAIVRSRTGRPFPGEDFARFVGHPVHDMYAWIREHFRLPDSVEELMAERAHRLQTAYARPRLMPGVTELVSAALGRGMALAIASSSPAAFVHTAAAALPFADSLGAVVSAEHRLVREPKPAPDIYLAACRLLAVSPSAALALEDSPTGAQAALRAGLTTVVVPGVWTEGATFPDGVTRVTSLADVVPQISAA